MESHKDRALRMCTYAALLSLSCYALYQYNQSIDEEDDASDSESGDSVTKSSDLFWCPRELFGLVVPLITQDVPDPTHEGFVPKRLLEMEYAVRGLVPTVAASIEAEMSKGKKFPFEKLLYCNIGNPIAVGHQPYTYIRQLSAAYWSGNFEDLPKDLNTKLTRWTRGHKSGSYTNHRGAPGFLKACADFLDRRDAFDNESFTVKSKNTEILLSDGASGGIVTILECLMDTAASDQVNVQFSNPDSMTELKDNIEDIHKNVRKMNRAKRGSGDKMPSGVFCPIPQYPLYSATIKRLGGTIIPYVLDEDDDWNMPNMVTMETLYAESVSKGIFPKAAVVINPGNPSGNLLTRDDVANILRFCERHRMVVLADEVYQENIWSSREFYSMRRVAFEEEIDCKIVTLHSCSKGLYGECGVRGGITALDNFPEHLVELIDKCFSVRLCPNVTGQITMAAVCSPPVEGDDSYELFNREKSTHSFSMQEKAIVLVEKLNSLEGVTCNMTRGALYAFPKITLPQKVILEAKKQSLQADAFYCLELLNSTGIVTVPGSGFKQAKGTFHFRITILPQIDDLREALDRLAVFHNRFLAKWS